jgi:hypothetical protein
MADTTAVRNLTLELDWLPVHSSEGVPYSFPDPISKFFKGLWSGPAVYRWSVSSNGVTRQVYYGEAENLSRRTDGYKRGHPGQQTNARIKAHFGQLLIAGHTISLHRLTFAPFSFNGVLIQEKDLSRKEVRCFLENALMVTVPPGIELLNKATSVEAKKTKKALAVLDRLTPDQRNEIALRFRGQGSSGKN